MKTRVIACIDKILSSGENLRKGEVYYLEEEQAKTLEQEKVVVLRGATAPRSAAILPEHPSISAEKCRQ